jgi:2-iminobutanoate/2-iminopropanoate deaminase
MSNVTHINPPDLFTSPALSQGTMCEAGRILYVGGQNGRDKSGKMVDGGIAEQTKQALRNVLSVLAAVGASQENVAKLSVYLDPSVDPNEAFAASAEVWGAHATAITVLRVGLGVPGALVEIEAVAAIP